MLNNALSCAATQSRTRRRGSAITSATGALCRMTLPTVSTTAVAGADFTQTSVGIRSSSLCLNHCTVPIFLPVVPPQSRRSSAYTRSTWMNFTVAFRSPTRKKRKSTASFLFCCPPCTTRFWFVFGSSYFLFLCRLAEKRAAIGYTYEDGIVPEPEPQSDKDEDNSENSESEEDEGIPDIGENVLLSGRCRPRSTTGPCRRFNVCFMPRCGGGCG